MKMSRKDELTSKLIKLNIKASDIRKELDKIQFDSIIETYNSYIGKYFIKVDDYKDTCVIYCSSVDIEKTQLVALLVSYYGDGSQYYSIQNEEYFDPINKYGDNENEIVNFSTDVWKEIDKSEFFKHYNHVQSIINKKLGNE